MVTTLLAFAITILVIVAIHEYGHYLAMRLFGVRVLVFSIGFGPQLAKWKSKKTGTKFVISAIPLGGYVRPLDRRDAEILPGQEEEEFSHKPAWQRVIVYAAGPVANFVLAIFLYWTIFLGGQLGVPPVLGEVVEGTPAAAAGLQKDDEIVELGGKEVLTWQQVNMELIRHVGSTEPLAVTVVNAEQQRQVLLDIAPWSQDPEAPVFEVLGIKPRPLAPILGRVVQDGAADKAGLQERDRILSANGKAVDSWSDWVAVVQNSPETPITLEVLRGQKTHQLTLTPQLKEHDGERIGLAGVQLGGLRQLNYGFFESMGAALTRTLDQVTMILSSFKKMLLGQLSVKTLGGPITIAQAAGETAAIGYDSFLLFLAFFSISLGVINLLPVPMLDGGWIMFGLVEMVRRKPLSEAFLMSAQKMGFALVLALMSLAIFNDLVRQFS